MLITLAAFALSTAQPITTFARPEAPRTREQQAQDDENAVSEGERAGDGGTPDRLICNWERVPGAIRRERVCRTVADRAATREVARETIQSMQGSVTDAPFDTP
jgi:hypothetical protein